MRGLRQTNALPGGHATEHAFDVGSVSIPLWEHRESSPVSTTFRFEKVISKIGGDSARPLSLWRHRLTIDHLENAALAGEPVRELITRGDDVAGMRSVDGCLVGLTRDAGGLDVIPPPVPVVDGAPVSVVHGTAQRVHVEAPLRHGAIDSVGEIVDIADEELEVALGAFGGDE